MVTNPDSGFSTPQMVRSVVVFPAPFTPSKPVIAPSRASNDRSFSTGLPWKDFLSFSSLIMFVCNGSPGLVEFLTGNLQGGTGRRLNCQPRGVEGDQGRAPKASLRDDDTRIPDDHIPVARDIARSRVFHQLRRLCPQ